MSKSANARPRKSSGIACCMIVSAEIFADEEREEADEQQHGEPGERTRRPEHDRPDAEQRPSSRAAAGSAGRVSFQRLREHQAERAADEPAAHPTRPSESVSASPPSTRFFAYSANTNSVKPQNW